MCSCCHLKSSFYPLNLIPDRPHSLTQLYWLTNLSSPLTSLLLLSFSSGSFWANINADTHLSSHALFSLAVNVNHVQKTIPKKKMSELQANTQKLWNTRIKISSARNLNKPLHKRKDILIVYQLGKLFRVSYRSSEQSENPWHTHTVPFKEVGLQLGLSTPSRL